MITFKTLSESLRSDIAKVASKYPEGSTVNVKGKDAKVVSHGKDFLVVAMGNKTMNVNLKDVVKEADEPASPDEASMALDQAKFIGYVAEEIMEYINGNKDFPEWMQNKLSGLHEKAKGMHAVLAGKYDESVKEEAEVEESTAAYAASLEKIANDKKLKNISKKDRDMLVKLADLMKNANEK